MLPTPPKWLAKWQAESEVGFTTGLLHSIGQLLIHLAAPADASAIDKLVANGASARQRNEHLRFQPISDVGAELARRWNFPENIQQAIKHHHKPLESEPFIPWRP